MPDTWDYLSTQLSSPLQLDLHQSLQIARLVVVMEVAGSEEHSTKSLDVRKSGDMGCRHTGSSWFAPVLGQSRSEGMIDGIALDKWWAGMQSLDLRRCLVIAGRGVAMSKRADIDVEQCHWVGVGRNAVGAASLDVLEPGSPKDSLGNRTVVF